MRNAEHDELLLAILASGAGEAPHGLAERYLVLISEPRQRSCAVRADDVVPAFEEASVDELARSWCAASSGTAARLATYDPWKRS